MNANPKVGVLLVLLAAALWGTTGTAQALSGAQLPALWFGALRLLLASVFFAVYAAATSRGGMREGLGRLHPADVIGAGLCMAVYNLAFFAGIRQTGVAVGTAIALGSGPIWAGLLQAAIQRTPPTAAWWVGTLTAVAGGAMLTAGGDAAAGDVAASGVLLCLASGLSYAVYTLLNKRMAAVAPAGTITLLAFSIAAAVALPAAWWEAGWPVIRATDAAAAAYTGFATAGVAYLLFSHALRHITPATGVTLALVEPMVAFGLAVMVLGERPAPIAFAGLAGVVIGVLAVVRAELAAAPRRPALLSPTS